MKGNEKIAFTAEAIALMRAREKTDIFSKYFVSPEIQKKFRFIKTIIPRSYLDKIFRKRIALSKDLDRLIETYQPEQIVELACGYSPRGLVMTQKDPALIYVETDFSTVIERKKDKIKEIETKEGIRKSENHHLIAVDAINVDLCNLLHDFIGNKKKVLVIAETLTSYLDPMEHEFLISNIEKYLDQFERASYLSHEVRAMLPGFFGKCLLFYRDKVAKTKSYKHFSKAEEIESYFLKRGYIDIKIVQSKESNNILYLATRK